MSWYVLIVYDCYTHLICKVETGQSVEGAKFGTRTTSDQLQIFTDFVSNRSQFSSHL